MLAGVAAGALVLGATTAAEAEPAAPTPTPGAAWTWGSNDYGQLGNGSTGATPRPPAAVPGPTDFVDMDGGREHVVALTSTGEVYTWGSDQEGQLGDNATKANKSVPTKVSVPCAGGGPVSAVETGHNSTVVLCANGTVFDWGLNSDGQLGDGTRTMRFTPVQVSGITDAVAVAAGRDMTYAVRSNGTMLAWGDNSHGELGDGTKTDRLTPVPVSGLTGVVGVGGGRDHAVVLRSDGSVWAFGWNAYGQLGDGTLTDRTTPVQVTTSAGKLTGVTEVDAGAHHSYALLASGGVVSWGRNYRDELGDGTMTNRTRAVPVLGVSGAVSIGSGRDSGLAVLGDGTVRAWGHNAYGQLGDGTTTSRTSAVTVPGVSDAVKAAGGGSAYLSVLVASGPPAPKKPVARFTWVCDQLSCTLDGNGSTDEDGTLTSYDWAFGDSSDTGPTVHKDFAATGTYPVTLTVTDDDGLTGEVTMQVSVSDAPPPTLAFRAVKAYDANVTKPTVTVASEPGDQVVVFMTTNRLATTATPAGWTLEGSVVDGSDLKSWVFSRVAGAGGTTTFAPTLDATSKTNLTALSYSGAGDPTATGANEPGTTAMHASPAAAVVTAGSTVVSYWADKPSAAHGWSLPAPLTQRSASAGTGGGLLTSTVGDTADVASGTWPGAVGNAGASSAKAVSWSVVLPPA